MHMYYKNMKLFQSLSECSYTVCSCINFVGEVHSPVCPSSVLSSLMRHNSYNVKVKRCTTAQMGSFVLLPFSPSLSTLSLSVSLPLSQSQLHSCSHASDPTCWFVACKDRTTRGPLFRLICIPGKSLSAECVGWWRIENFNVWKRGTGRNSRKWKSMTLKESENVRQADIKGSKRQTQG